MKLLIDSGNTRCKYALSKERKITRVTRNEAIEQLNAVTKVIYADVSNSDELQEVITVANENKIETFRATTKKSTFGVESGYPNFSTLGIDRWLGVLATDVLYPNESCVIVDAGTAITIDIINDKKQHQGGWIVPGVQLMEKSIVEKAPHVFSSNDAKLETFGTTTPNALRSGVFHMACGAIERAVRLCIDKYKPLSPPKVILTGGDAEALSHSLNVEFEIVDDLIFIGLNRFD